MLLNNYCNWTKFIISPLSGFCVIPSIQPFVQLLTRVSRSLVPQVYATKPPLSLHYQASKIWWDLIGGCEKLLALLSIFLFA